MQFENLKIATEILTREDYCPKHGEFISKSIFEGIWMTCPHCFHEGVKAREKEVMERENCINAWEEIPERYRNASFDSFICEDNDGGYKRRILQRLANYKADKNIIMTGEKGTGKTHLAWSIYKKIPGTIVTTLMDMLRNVRSTYGGKGDEIGAVEKYAGAKLLIIDEIGFQAGTESEINIIFDIINKRYNALKYTIIISNLPPKPPESDDKSDCIYKFMGGPAFDRIESDALIIDFNWDNYRHARLRKAGKK